MDNSIIKATDLESFQNLTRSLVLKIRSSESWRCECPELVDLYEIILQFVYFNRTNPIAIKDVIEWVLSETQQTFLLDQEHDVTRFG